MFKPTMLKKNIKRSYKKNRNIDGNVVDKKDMQRRFASAGPNKQMYDMYNMSLRDSAMNEPVGYVINHQQTTPQLSNVFGQTSNGDAFNLVSDQNSKSQQLFQSAQGL